ncbi:MAG: flagella basal body P-ring formation protein FlgA [Bacillota bacterium]
MMPSRSGAARASRIEAFVLAAAVGAVVVAALPAPSACAGSMPATAKDRGAARLVVELKPQAEVAGPAIRIGDVAVLVDGDPELWETVSRLEVGAAPLPGESRSISKAAIILRLRQARIDPGLIRWGTQAEETSVSAFGRALDRAPVTRGIEQYLAARRERDGGPDLTVLDLEVPERVLVPPGEIRAAVVSGPPVLRPGAAVFAVEVLVDGVAARRVWVRATLGTDGPDRGAPVDARDVPVRPQEGGSVPSGTPVTVLVRRGAVTVQLQGVLQGPARVGQAVQVRNATSGAVMHAVLVRPDLAVVAAPEGP